VAELIQNSSASTLNATINNVVTSLTVANGAVFPATGNFRILVDSELMLCTARASNVLTVTRGVETTTAAGHTSGAAVTHIITALGLSTYISENSIAKTIADAKGDIITATAADTMVRKAVGANATVLMADSTQSDGLVWGGTWAAYTPAWTSSGTAPAIGNGTISGRFSQLGKTVFYKISVVAGSTTTFGTGTYFFSLPVTAAASAFTFGFARAIDTGVLQYPGFAVLQSTTLLLPITGAGATWSNTVPFTFANTDQMVFDGTYEAA
jgi:hypothetical protein